MKRQIKAIALDLDGTTLLDNKDISIKVKEALHSAWESGAVIIIATGRSWVSLPDALKEVPEITYVITSNGAYAYRYPQKEVLFREMIPSESVKQLHDLIRKHHLDTEVFFHGQGYIQEEYYQRVLANKTNRIVEYVKKSRQPVKDVAKILIDQDTEIENVCFYFSTLEEKERICREIEKIPEVTIASAFDYNLEIGSRYSSKGAALEKLLDILGLLPEDLMAVGDAMNDVQMIQLAGIGIAMGNAPDELKELADYVTADNGKDGVALAIRKFVTERGIE